MGMSILKGDKVKYLDLEGVAISNPYMYISDMETYIDVYCNDIKEHNEKLLSRGHKFID